MPSQHKENAFISPSGFYMESLCSSVLGSTSAITDANGSLTQHVLYFAYGEQFVDEHRNSTNSPYLFNGKEYDEETGRYYYGARYYDPRVSLWIGVDPLAGKYPSMSPYNYCATNPLLYIDPNGKDIVIHYLDENGKKSTYNYAPGSGYIGDNSFVEKKVDYLNKIYATDKGKRKIAKLSGNQFHLDIKETTNVKNNNYVGSWDTGIKNQGLITAASEGGTLTEGFSYTDAFEAFAHEIQHAFDDSRGLKYNKSDLEMNAVHFQNYITSVYGTGSMRTGYFGLFKGLSSDERTYNEKLEKISEFRNIPTYHLPPETITHGSENSDRLRKTIHFPGIITKKTSAYKKSYSK